MYSLSISIPKDYPQEPPEVRFISPKIAMECVNSKGRVNLRRIEIVLLEHLSTEGTVEKGSGIRFVWNPHKNIADVLAAIRSNMHLKSVCKLSHSITQQSYC